MKMNRKYEIYIVPNAYGGFYARIPDFPTIFTGGITRKEALRNAEEAIELMIEDMEAHGEPLPKPKSSFSGHLNIRIPRELHSLLTHRAQEEGVSLNSMISYLLSRDLTANPKGGSSHHHS
jgi:predicted RNase H-like HicB family nuclease